MEKELKIITDLIATIRAIEENRTAHLDVAVGGLLTARDQIKAHLARLSGSAGLAAIPPVGSPSAGSPAAQRAAK